jgi:hypothetical protein
VNARTGTVMGLATVTDTTGGGPTTQTSFVTYQFKTNIAVATGTPATATLVSVDPSTLSSLTVNIMNPPAGLGTSFSTGGLQIPNNGTLLYGYANSDTNPMKVPLLTGMFAGGSYRVYAIVGSTTQTSAQLVSQTTTTFNIDNWLNPTAGFSAATDQFSYTAVPTGAQVMTMRTAALEVLVFDGSTTVALPADFHAPTGNATLYASRPSPAIDVANFGFGADGVKFTAYSSATDMIN